MSLDDGGFRVIVDEEADCTAGEKAVCRFWLVVGGDLISVERCRGIEEITVGAQYSSCSHSTTASISVAKSEGRIRLRPFTFPYSLALLLVMGGSTHCLLIFCRGSSCREESLFAFATDAVIRRKRMHARTSATTARHAARRHGASGNGTDYHAGTSERELRGTVRKGKRWACP